MGFSDSNSFGFVAWRAASRASDRAHLTKSLTAAWPLLPQPLEGPYYGIKVTVALYHTQGGLKVNANGQVLRADGSIIPNLYAGGGVAVGVSGKGLEGYLPGNGLLASLGLGMIAAQHAVASLNGN